MTGEPRLIHLYVLKLQAERLFSLDSLVVHSSEAPTLPSIGDHQHGLIFWQSVIDMMSDIAGYRIDVHVNPAFVRANEVVRLTGDNRRLQAVVGTIDPPPLEQTLRWMYEA